MPTRVEITSERDKRETALDLAQRTFTPFLDHLPPDVHGRYWGGVQMAYFPYYAFEEIPAVFGDKPDDLLSLSTAIKEIARAITNPPVATLPALAEDPETAEKIRKEIVGWYLRAQPNAEVAQLQKATQEAQTRAAELETLVERQRVELGAAGGVPRSGRSRWAIAITSAVVVLVAVSLGVWNSQQRAETERQTRQMQEAELQRVRATEELKRAQYELMRAQEEVTKTAAALNRALAQTQARNDPRSEQKSIPKTEQKSQQKSQQIQQKTDQQGSQQRAVPRE